MNDQERKVMKRALKRVRPILWAAYCWMRDHGMAVDDDDALEIAAALLELFGDDAEMVYSGYRAVEATDVDEPAGWLPD